MMKFLELVLDTVNDKMKKMLRRFFDAGVAHAKDGGPDFDTYLAEQLKKAKGES